MAKNFNVSTDEKVNAWLASLPTANKLWLILIAEAEDEVGPTDVLSGLTQSVATEIGVTGLTSTNRIVDLGGPHNWPEIVGSPKAILVLDDDPDNVGANPVAIEDINGGAALDLSVSGPYSASTLSIKFAYDSEA